VKRWTRIIGVVAVVAAAALGAYMLLRRDNRDGWIGRDRDDRPVVPPDPWDRGVTNDFIRPADSQELDRTEFAMVSQKEPEALARLERSAWVELSSQAAEELAGRPLGGTGGRLVLLRGLGWDTPYGAFTVSWRPGAVRVNHGCLGRHRLPVVRRAVVARLPDLPEEVYVDLSMVE
jgi:hypothetical protein